MATPRIMAFLHWSQAWKLCLAMFPWCNVTYPHHCFVGILEHPEGYIYEKNFKDSEVRLISSVCSLPMWCWRASTLSWVCCVSTKNKQIWSFKAASLNFYWGFTKLSKDLWNSSHWRQVSGGLADFHPTRRTHTWNAQCVVPTILEISLQFY